MDYQQLITFIMEMVGTVAFAASGAMIAVDRAMDIFGVIVLGVTTAVESNLYTGSDNYIVCGLSDLVCEKRTSAGA